MRLMQRGVIQLKRFLLAPDSFKGTMNSEEVCRIVADAILNHIPDAEIQTIPMADGGEGMTEAYLRLFGGERERCRVSGPLGEEMDVYYGLLPDGSAVAEMAICAGLPLMEGKLAPMHATTKGVGDLILCAQRRGIRRLLLGLGGSATNDGGIGMAGALGYRFFDAEGAAVEPVACNMGKIARIVPPECMPEMEVRAACDVDNPLCGENGASSVFGPQKGASGEDVAALDAGLKNLAAVIRRDLGVDVETVPGAGAAGGLGAGIMAFLRGKLMPGVELLLDAAEFDEKVAQCDLVITGEGRMDGQSVRGKVPVGVARRARAAGVPCVALCGSLGDGAEAVYPEGITAAFAAVRGCQDFETVKRTCREDMRVLADSVIRLILAFANAPDTDGVDWLV